jgi:hypothetical protein
MEEAYISTMTAVLSYLNQNGTMKMINTSDLLLIDQMINLLNQEVNDKPSTTNANLALKCLQVRIQYISRQPKPLTPR